VPDGEKGTEMEYRQLVNKVLMLVEAGQVDQAIETVRGIKSMWWRFKAFREASRALIKTSQFDQAVKVLDQVNEGVKEIEGAGWRAEVLIRISAALLGAGQFDQAIKVANKIEDASKRIRVLTGITTILVEKGEINRAAQEIESKQGRPITLRIIESGDEEGRVDKIRQLRLVWIGVRRR